MARRRPVEYDGLPGAASSIRGPEGDSRDERGDQVPARGATGPAVRGRLGDLRATGGDIARGTTRLRPGRAGDRINRATARMDAAPSGRVRPERDANPGHPSRVPRSYHVETAGCRSGDRSRPSFYFTRDKLAANTTLDRQSNDSTVYPVPDLAVEVDISDPQIDRLAVYATIGVAEVWRFVNGKVWIERLGKDGTYKALAHQPVPAGSGCRHPALAGQRGPARRVGLGGASDRLGAGTAESPGPSPARSRVGRVRSAMSRTSVGSSCPTT